MHVMNSNIKTIKLQQNKSRVFKSMFYVIDKKDITYFQISDWKMISNLKAGWLSKIRDSPLQEIWHFIVTYYTGEIKEFLNQVNQTVFIQAIIQITDLLALTKTP